MRAGDLFKLYSRAPKFHRCIRYSSSYKPQKVPTTSTGLFQKELETQDFAGMNWVGLGALPYKMSKTFTRQAITCLVLIGCFMFPVCVVYSRCLPMKENSKAYWEEHRLAIERLRDPNYVPESEDEDEDEDGDGDGDADNNGEGDDDGDGDDG